MGHISNARRSPIILDNNLSILAMHKANRISMSLLNRGPPDWPAWGKIRNTGLKQLKAGQLLLPRHLLKKLQFLLKTIQLTIVKKHPALTFSWPFGLTRQSNSRVPTLKWNVRHFKILISHRRLSTQWNKVIACSDTPQIVKVRTWTHDNSVHCNLQTLVLDCLAALHTLILLIR